MRLTISKTLLIIIVFSIVSGVHARDEKDQIIFQQKELEDIKKEVKQRKQKLDSLKNAEVNFQKEISEFNQEINTNLKVVSRLNNELSQLKKQISQTESELEASQLNLELALRRYLGNIRQFYLTAHKPPDIFSEDPNEELVLNRQIVYLTALADFESGMIEQASIYLEETIDRQKDLSGQTKQISSLKKKKETAAMLASTQKDKQEKNLEKVRQRKTEEADKIVTLEQAAREMEQIIARLQKEAERRKAGEADLDQGPSVFATMRGQLLSPYKGKITVPYGDLVDPVTNLKSFSSGITISGKPYSSIVAVSSGTLAYIGNLRGYGNFVIINHDDQYYTTYAGLSKTLVSVNEYILAGNKIGESGADGIIKFELRQGSKPLDPVKWIRIDSF